MSQPDIQAVLKKLDTYFNQFVSIDNKLVSIIEKISKINLLKTGDFFIEEGHYCRHIAYIYSGAFRFFHLHDGDEITRDFIFSNNIMTSFTSLITKKPSKTSIQAIEPSCLLIFEYQKFEMLFDKYPIFEKLSRILSEIAYINLEEHYLSFLNDNAKTRYENLLNKNRHIVQNIPLQYIASFLGITPQHLSRIRKEIFQ